MATDQDTASRPTTPQKTSFVLRSLLFFFAGLIVISVITLVAGYAYFQREITRVLVFPNQTSLTLTIEKGMSTSKIADMLVEKKVISHPLILRGYLFLHRDKTIQAGYFRIPAKGLTFEKLVDQLQKGSFETKLTFVEGWRVEEYRDYLTKKMGKTFADTFMTSPQIKEGYLFPDTYIVDTEYDPTQLASWMRNTFEKRVTPELRAKAKERGLSEEQVIILASILEREMNIKKDRPIVAGILIKRMQNGWPLQADATVQYAKGDSTDWWPTAGRSDLRKVESPYNTYTNKGLPPAPICNPGLDAIQSVVNYVETPNWFYVTGNDGVTRYAETLEQHNKNVADHL